MTNCIVRNSLIQKCSAQRISVCMLTLASADMNYGDFKRCEVCRNRFQKTNKRM